MKKIYLAIVVVCTSTILIIGFQNIILMQNAYLFVSIVNAGILEFIVAIIGFIGGGALLLYYKARQSEGKEEDDGESV